VRRPTWQQDHNDRLFRWSLWLEGFRSQDIGKRRSAKTEAADTQKSAPAEAVAVLSL
jgi:hypothetical protein